MQPPLRSLELLLRQLILQVVLLLIVFLQVLLLLLLLGLPLYRWLLLLLLLLLLDACPQPQQHLFNNPMTHLLHTNATDAS